MPEVLTFSSMKSLAVSSQSHVMKEVLEAARNIAVSDLGVLIVGESGTEKELLARRIHELSVRSAGEFVHLKCGTFSDDLSGKQLFGSEELTFSGIEIHRGIFELASGGTIYFDGIAELPRTVQNRICRAVEEQQFRRVGGLTPIAVNVRLISSIDRKSGDIMWNAPAREPYCHLSSVQLNLPPLRERREDIKLHLAQFMLNTQNTAKRRPAGISAEALDLLLAYDWPGNTQELYGAMEHAIAVCSDEYITRRHLPERVNRIDREQPQVGADQLMFTWSSARFSSDKG
jgi:transcriptional regulator with PAS, ATPase and Fis domain